MSGNSISSELLDLIPSAQVAPNAISLSEAIDAIEFLDENGGRELELAFLAVTLRAIETRILADPALRRLAIYWNTYRGQADEIIRTRLENLTGTIPTEELVAYFKACIRSKPSADGGSGTIGEDTFVSVVEMHVNSNPRRELRCGLCGYHFRPDDLGKRRQFLVDQFDVVLASAMHPGRLSDVFKPWQINGTSCTNLSLDHVTPEAGLGWTAADNLQVVCKFCNEGKLIYRRPSEPISTVIAASLQACPSIRPHSRARQIAIVAAISSVNQCMRCGRGKLDVELSVEIPEEQTASRWLTPWCLYVKCYGC